MATSEDLNRERELEDICLYVDSTLTKDTTAAHKVNGVDYYYYRATVEVAPYFTRFEIHNVQCDDLGDLNKDTDPNTFGLDKLVLGDLTWGGKYAISATELGTLYGSYNTPENGKNYVKSATGVWSWNLDPEGLNIPSEANPLLLPMVVSAYDYTVAGYEAALAGANRSIKVVAREERKAKEDAFWNEIEEGKYYDGVVKSLTAYGAFVDLGGVDGMVHMSELSWLRISKPSDVVAVGDKLTVFVKSFDKEKGRISLGYKTEESNPWTLFRNANNVDDVVTVKIVSMMPFGAFAQIIPGVDGLIHISQIANKKLASPAEVLEKGQEVEAKITDIDDEKKKVSLSIRALLVEEPVEEAVDAEYLNSKKTDSNCPSFYFQKTRRHLNFPTAQFIFIYKYFDTYQTMLQ